MQTALQPPTVPYAKHHTPTSPTPQDSFAKLTAPPFLCVPPATLPTALQYVTTAVLVMALGLTIHAR